MEAKELRIDNVVEWNRRPFLIKSIDKSYVENELWSKPINEIHPIHLTEEILLKCGFEKTQFGYGDKYIDIECIGDGNYKLSIEFGDHVLGFGEDIKYIHKLQNIYFELTGKELDVSNLIK